MPKDQSTLILLIFDFADLMNQFAQISRATRAGNDLQRVDDDGVRHPASRRSLKKTLFTELTGKRPLCFDSKLTLLHKVELIEPGPDLFPQNNH